MVAQELAPLPPVYEHKPPVHPNWVHNKILARIGFLLVALPVLLLIFFCTSNDNSATATAMVLLFGSYVMFISGWLLIFLSILQSQVPFLDFFVDPGYPMGSRAKVLAWLGFLFVALPVLLQVLLCADVNGDDANSKDYISTATVLLFGSYLIFIFGWVLIFLSME
ncbi:uncharacterized protein [Typha latifolia]|uniref:uncharacterized protein isoform X3 n=1 Tax=Typha latifolia TaxID=4733 RepID=UPI003C2F63A3